MKEVHIECAGAGKTYGIAQKAIKMLTNCPKEKNIYIITYTNYAVAQIKSEIEKHNQQIPKNIIVDTIHGFLLNLIIYPFSCYVKGYQINTCSIEKLCNDIKYKNLRIKQLKANGIIHSSEVTKFAKSLIIHQTSDRKIDKSKKNIALEYLISDIFCLFVDEAQDMEQDFFDLMYLIINQINNYYFVGDPNQAITSSDFYKQFVTKLCERENIKYIENLVSRRIPQSIVPLCNEILPENFQLSSCNSKQGEISYILMEELSDEDKSLLSKINKFTYIKEKNECFSTGYEKAYIPNEIVNTLGNNFPQHDIDAIKHCAQIYIKKYGINKFFSNFDIPYDKKLYAILSSQFNNAVDPPTPIYSIHKVKGLENDAAYFIVCKSLLEIMLGLKNNHDKESNLLYVALTRSKNRLILIIDDSCSVYKPEISRKFSELHIAKANKSQWF